MTARHGVIVVDPRSRSGVATVRISLEDAGMADAASVRLAEATLPGRHIGPGERIPFEIEVDPDPPPGTIVRVHVDFAGDGDLSLGDLFTTRSIPDDVLGDAAESAGEVPVAVI